MHHPLLINPTAIWDNRSGSQTDPGSAEATKKELVCRERNLLFLLPPFLCPLSSLLILFPPLIFILHHQSAIFSASPLLPPSSLPPSHSVFPLRLSLAQCLASLFLFLHRSQTTQNEFFTHGDEKQRRKIRQWQQRKTTSLLILHPHHPLYRPPPTLSLFDRKQKHGQRRRGQIMDEWRMNRLWIKKEKMAAHPIAEASITLPLSLCLPDREQSAGRAGSQSQSRDWERGGSRRRRKGAYLPLHLLLLPQCFAAAAASRLTGLLRDSHTSPHTHLDFCPCKDQTSDIIHYEAPHHHSAGRSSLKLEQIGMMRLLDTWMTPQEDCGDIM